MNSTSFGEYVNVGGFNQKTIKVALFIKVNHVYPRRNRLRKNLEHSRRQLIETHAQGLTCGAGRPVSVTGGPYPQVEASKLNLELFSVGFVSQISF